jgi:hypothetical protein
MKGHYMHFLCNKHLEQIIQLPQSSVSEIWLNWIQQASSLNELQQWHLSIPFLGCAFDLSCELFTNANYDNDNTAIQLTLSSIYLANTFLHFNDKENSDLTLNIGLRTLHQHWLKDQHSKIIHECLEVILNEQQHLSFFQKHLNLTLIQPCAILHSKEHLLRESALHNMPLRVAH